MSIEQIEKEILQLSETDRKKLARWFYDHEDKLLGREDDEEEEDLDEEQKAEILRRAREVEENPDILIPFTEEGFDKMIQGFADARAKRTSSGQK